MILAINANAAIDQVLFIEQFIGGTVMRPHNWVLSVGGKALDSAVVLKTLGAPVQAVSLVAGRNGETLAGLLREREIDSDLVWVPGETRISHVIVETALKRHSHITTSGYTVTQADCARFLERIACRAGEADWAVVAGSLPGGAPPDLYRQITDLLHRSGVRVLIDTSGNPALEALAAAPEILKMNEHEFASTFQAQADNLEGWIAAGRREAAARGIQTLVLTLGRQGFLVISDGSVYHATSPRMEEVNAAGSGDAVSAALAYRLSLGDGWEQALRWAAATSAAVVLTEGTAECRIEDIQRIFPLTEVRTIATERDRQ
jgi:1-phosphofructokinase family hexose kinase